MGVHLPIDHHHCLSAYIFQPCINSRHLWWVVGWLASHFVSQRKCEHYWLNCDTFCVTQENATITLRRILCDTRILWFALCALCWEKPVTDLAKTDSAMSHSIQPKQKQNHRQKMILSNEPLHQPTKTERESDKKTQQATLSIQPKLKENQR